MPPGLVNLIQILELCKEAQLETQREEMMASYAETQRKCMPGGVPRIAPLGA